MKMNVIKCHGTGNDFVLVDEINNDYGFNEEDRVKFTVEVCKRDGIIGADGVLFVQKSEKYDGKMRIFNSDGTEPEMCGNGLRCVGRFILQTSKKDVVEVETMKAVYTVKKVQEIYDGVFTDEITIKSVSFDVNDLPLNYHKKNLFFEKIEALSDELTFTAVSITNPHLVSIMDEIDTDTLVKVGKEANTNKEVCPKGTNINFVKILDENSIYVRTYERGVGLTKSCGTGMISSSITTCIDDENKLGKELNVYNDGGMIKCTVNKDEEGNVTVQMKGNATFVFKSELEINDYENVKEIHREYVEKENNAYDEFLKYVENKLN